MRGAFLFLLFLGLLARCDAGLKTETEEPIALGLTLAGAEFGLIVKGEDGVVQFKAADKIPLVAGQMYGWRLRFRGQRKIVGLREEFQLPVAPKVWNSPDSGGDFKVSPDGRTGTTEADAIIEDGALMHAWAVADGDPAGAHVIRLYLEGKLVRTFNFEVVAPQR
jgi:hypothetical protein